MLNQGSDDLHVASCQRGLEDVGGIHGAAVSTPSSAHQRVDLIDHEDDVPSEMPACTTWGGTENPLEDGRLMSF